jgi:hypothetical protein
MSFSDYIVYVDESGDHGLERIDPEYPVFVLAFCIFKKSVYLSEVVPQLHAFKFRYWGHDAVVLHEHEIRKSMAGDYSILSQAQVRAPFLRDLSGMISRSPFHVIATVLRKDVHRARYSDPAHPYYLSLLYCLERLKNFLGEQNQNTQKTTHLIFESRGKTEDQALELEFRRIMDGVAPTYMNKPHVHEASFAIRFIPKSANSVGLQLADLIARPIGLKALRPNQPNRAFDIIEPKLFVRNGTYHGHGLKVVP